MRSNFFACVQVDAYDGMIYDPKGQPDGDVSELLHYVDDIAVQSRYIGVTPQDQGHWPFHLRRSRDQRPRGGVWAAGTYELSRYGPPAI